MIESPMAVTPWPKAGGPAVVVVVGDPGAGVGPMVEVGRWWWTVGTMEVTCDAGSAAVAATTPNRPSPHRRALNRVAPTSTHPTGRSWGHTQLRWRTRSQPRLRAPCRTGCSM